MLELANYAKTFLGKPYIWGGDTPMVGFDCSGLVLEILKSVGMAPLEDMTSQSMYDYFRASGFVSQVGIGALCFYGKGPKQISHVAMMINDHQVIEAGGGTSHTIGFEEAIQAKAFVRLRPFHHRQDLIEVILPIYPEWVKRI